MRSSVCPALPTASVVRGLSRDHDRRRGQRCTVLNHPVSLINRGKLVQRNRATANYVNLEVFSTNFEVDFSFVLTVSLKKLNRLNFLILLFLVLSSLYAV